MAFSKPQAGVNLSSPGGCARSRGFCRQTGPGHDNLQTRLLNKPKPPGAGPREVTGPRQARLLRARTAAGASDEHPSACIPHSGSSCRGRPSRRSERAGTPVQVWAPRAAPARYSPPRSRKCRRARPAPSAGPQVVPPRPLGAGAVPTSERLESQERPGVAVGGVARLGGVAYSGLGVVVNRADVAAWLLAAERRWPPRGGPGKWF